MQTDPVGHTPPACPSEDVAFGFSFERARVSQSRHRRPRLDVALGSRVLPIGFRYGVDGACERNIDPEMIVDALHFHQVNAAPDYPRLSLAPGQRFASKGVIVRFTDAHRTKVTPLGDWITP